MEDNDLAIPDFQSCMLPLLKLISSKEIFSMKQVVDELADEFKLSAEERIEQLPSGRAKLFYNRVAWAKFYLKKAGLLESPKYGCIQITPKGNQLLQNSPAVLNIKYLEPMLDMEITSASNPVNQEESDIQNSSSRTPQESLELACESIRSELCGELLETVLSCSLHFLKIWSSIYY